MDQSEEPLSEESQLRALMVAYQGGDLQAFERLYALLMQPLRRYFRHAYRDSSVADDLVQETFLEMHRSRRTYMPPLPVRPWAFGVARNVLARRWRSTRALRMSQAHSLDEGNAPEPQSGELPVTDIIDLDAALATLPTATREPWLLHHLFGLGFDSVAGRLGITVMAAKLRSSRATKALRLFLSGPRETTR